MKRSLKKNKFILKIFEFFFRRQIKNIFKTSYEKTALLSYSTYPFYNKKNRLKHPNFEESHSLAEVLKNYKYNVDIYNATSKKKIDYSKYDLIIGEGYPLSNYFKEKKRKKILTINYSSTSHPFFNNQKSYQRLFQFYKKNGVYLEESSRIRDNEWGIASSLSDYNIIIGNEVTKKSFEKYSLAKKNYTLTPPYYKIVTEFDYTKKDKKNFLWFGSYGLIHKGLDVVIEAFLERKDLNLYICGYLDSEKEFLDIYLEKINKSNNIKLIGFIDLESLKFKEFMNKCMFNILSSCAEGYATALLTTCFNGGLIPIVTKETGVELEGFIIESPEKNSILKVLKEIDNIENDELVKLSKRIYKDLKNEIKVSDFYQNLFEIILEIHNLENIKC